MVFSRATISVSTMSEFRSRCPWDAMTKPSVVEQEKGLLAVYSGTLTSLQVPAGSW